MTIARTPIPDLEGRCRFNLTAEAGAAVDQVPPVRNAGQMNRTGYVPENDAYFEMLTETMNGRRQGRDPMSLPVEMLTAAGHRPRRTYQIVGAMGDVPLPEGIKGYKDIRRICMTCAENGAEVRRCIIVDCPAWAYRMGRNPHNPKRGRNPFVEPSISSHLTGETDSGRGRVPGSRSPTVKCDETV